MTRVVIQGLGFVGSAMSVALAAARPPTGEAGRFDVTGLDLPTTSGRARIDAINDGRFPFAVADESLTAAAAAGRAGGNLRATDDPAVIAEADVVVCDVHLDVRPGDASGPATVELAPFEAAIDSIAANVRPGALVVVETTVPPGTCERVVAPRLEGTGALLAHAYERVMPGPDYLRSITHFWRVYAGHTPEAADACERFLTGFIDVASHPLTRLASTTASEMAKVVENAYRATNIAFVEEWGRLAEAAGVDLFAVIDAIRVRPTHNNIRQPGLGVGGYCLTKDPLLGGVAARDLWDRPDLRFPFSELAVATNAASPHAAVARLTDLFGGELRDRRILVVGAAYRAELADTRQSPSETLVRACRGDGAQVSWHDPWVSRWEELDESRPDGPLPCPDGLDCVVFAVPHAEYRDLDVAAWLGDARPLILDANRVLSDDSLGRLSALGHRLASIGRGDG